MHAGNPVVSYNIGTVAASGKRVQEGRGGRAIGTNERTKTNIAYMEGMFKMEVQAHKQANVALYYANQKQLY